MSEPSPVSSSGAAEARKEALMVGDDVGDVLRLRSRVPHAPLERAAEQDSVGAREHVAELSLDRVADLRLRLEDRELAADRRQQLVAEQVAAAKPGAVEDQRFRQGRDLGRSRESPDLDSAAGD